MENLANAISQNAIQQHVLDEILGDFAIFMEPQLLLEPNFIEIKKIKVDNDKIKKYSTLLSNIDYAWKKVKKYQIYFQEFYPATTKIGKIEALNHHIHAYLNDMVRLRNKILEFFGTAKNDIKKAAFNKKEIEDFFQAGIVKTKEVFGQVTDQRDLHHHQGMRFFDINLLKAENAEGSIRFLNNPVINSILNQERKPELIERFRKEEDQSFEVARDSWVKMAQKNDLQIFGYLHEVFIAVKPALYQYLNMKPVKDIFKQPQQKV